MQIILNVPDTKLARVVDGVCGNGNYQVTLTDADGTETPNPVTKSQFAKEAVIKFLKDNVIAYERRIAQETAETTLVTDVNSINIS